MFESALMKMSRLCCLLGCLLALAISDYAQADEPSGILNEDGFQSIMPTKEASGWVKEVVRNEDGTIEGDGCYTKQAFANFILRFDFQLKPASNSGIGIRVFPGENAAFSGMEIQVLDDGHEQYKTIKEWQAHGSVYGIAPAKRGHLKPTGEWNTEEIMVNGRSVKVTLNGKVINEINLDQVAPNGASLDERPHPGLGRASGFISLCGHGGGVKFRNMRVMRLP